MALVKALTMAWVEEVSMQIMIASKAKSVYTFGRQTKEKN
jgi:hypothetical protein